MTATVHSFTSLVREHQLPCPCKNGVTCATHRCVDLADHLREHLTALDVDAPALLLDAETHRRVVGHVLDVLDELTAVTRDPHPRMQRPRRRGRDGRPTG